MKLFKLVCFSILLFVNHLVMAQDTTFSPHFFIESGFEESSFDESEFKGFKMLSDNLSLKVTGSYQFTPNWSASISASSRGTYHDEESRTDDESAYIVTGIRYETVLYSVVGGYDIALNDDWRVNVNAGVIAGKENKEIYICPSPRGFFLTCYSGNALSTSYYADTNVSFIVGTSVMYNFAKNWGVKLGYKFSGYREGLAQTELLIQYRF